MKTIPFVLFVTFVFVRYFCFCYRATLFRWPPTKPEDTGLAGTPFMVFEVPLVNNDGCYT